MKRILLVKVLYVLILKAATAEKYIKARLYRGLVDYFSTNYTLYCPDYGTHTQNGRNCHCNPEETYYSDNNGEFKCYSGIGWNLGEWCLLLLLLLLWLLLFCFNLLSIDYRM